MKSGQAKLSQLNQVLYRGLLTIGTMFAMAIAPQSAQAANITGGQTTANPYVTNVPGNGGYQITPLLTVGDEVQLLSGDLRTNLTPVAGQTFAFAGIPDGTGLFESGGYNYVFTNHEIGSSDTTAISSTVPGQIKGSRVSLFQFDNNWNVVGGKNLIETMVDNTTGTTYNLDTTTGAYTDAISGAAFSFSRFCSAYLAENGFVDQNGAPAPIYFAPEESGSGGRGFAVTPNGTAQALNGLGRYSKENVLAASQYRAGNPTGKTVLLSTEDFTDGEVYMFVGQQTASDPNGFADGDLYVQKVNNADFEGQISGSTTATWTLVDDAVALNPDGTVLSSSVNTQGVSTNFRRPEDIAEDPNNPGTFYFVTTGTADTPTTDTTNPNSPDATTPDQAENPYGKLYRFTLNPNDPTAPVTFELLVNGGLGKGVSYDNIVVDSNGNVLLQEDETAFGGDVMEAEGRDGRVLSYNIASGQITSVFEADENAAGSQYNDPNVRGEWETTGIIEVNPNAQPGRSSYLFNVQASTIPVPNYTRGGQMILVTPVPEPGTTAALTLFGLSAVALKLKQRRQHT